MDVSLSHLCLSLSLPSSLTSINTSSGEEFKKTLNGYNGTFCYVYFTTVFKKYQMDKIK